MSTNYPQRYQELQGLLGKLGKEMPGPASGFFQLHKAATAPGAVPAKYKELMALSIAVAVHCDNCIAYHVHDALKAQASRAEILETIGVAVMMGGGPALMYACEALEALNQYQPENTAAAR